MPFRASRIQTRILNTDDRDHSDISQLHIPLSPTRPSLYATYLSLPSPLSKASEESNFFTPTNSITSTMSSASTYLPSLPSTPIAVAKYLPAWWNKRKANKDMERMEEGEDVNELGNPIGGARQARKKRIKGAIEMVGMACVVFALLGLVVACVG